MWACLVLWLTSGVWAWRGPGVVGRSMSVRGRPVVRATDEAAALLAAAADLRKEVAEAEASMREERGEPEKAPAKKPQGLRITLPMSKPDWSVIEEEVEFAPRLEASELVRLDVPVPCGLVLEETEDGAVEVAQVAEGGNADLAGVETGWLLRATSAVRVQMEMPTWQLIGGGIGRPKFFRFIFGTDLAGPPPRTFDDVLAAVASNRQDPDGRPALLVLERPLDEE